MRIPLAKPTLGDAELHAVHEVLASGWITQGPRVAYFEEQFAARTGASHACAVANGTAALHLALLGAGVAPGDVVLTVSMSFIATANAIRACGAEPVFVDVDPQTLNMCPNALAKALLTDFVEHDGAWWFAGVDRFASGPSPLARTKAPCGRLAAILVVHQLGMPADLSKLLFLARQFNVPLIEDAACAIGSEISLDGSNWETIGKPHGQAATFSFHPRKVLTTGDGGMITTNNSVCDQEYRLYRQHGMSLSDLARHASRTVQIEQYLTTGFNYRLTDLQAAIGATQLSQLPTIIAQRRQVAEWYATHLSDIEELTLPSEPADVRTNWQSYQVHLEDASWQIPVLQGLSERGIGARRGVMCAHREAPYSDYWAADEFPASVNCMQRGIILPLYPTMTEDIVCDVADALRSTLAECGHRRAISCR